MTNRFALAALALAGAAVALPAAASYRMIGSGEDAQLVREAPATTAASPRMPIGSNDDARWLRGAPGTQATGAAQAPAGTPVLVGSGEDAAVLRN